MEGTEMPAGEEVRTILVVGPTGSGKSKLIKQLGGKHVETGDPPEISAGLGSCAREWATYDIGKYDNFNYHLIDTVGLMDTNRDDEKAVENMAKFLQQPTTVVGVIYVLSERMSPPEMEICKFFFDTFFQGLPSSRLLVLRTKYDEWQSYNAQDDKNFLRQQNAVPKRILDANFAAVDFHPAYGPDVVREMTGAVLDRIKLWTTYVSLSRQDEAKFVLSYRRLEDLRRRLEKGTQERDALINENKRLKLMVGPIKNFFRSLGKTLMSANYKNPILVGLMGFVLWKAGVKGRRWLEVYMELTG